MSVAEFDQTLQDRIFNKIKNAKRDDRKAYIESLDTNKLRKKYEAASSGASSVFTASGLDKLKVSLIEEAKTLSFASSASIILNSINYASFAKYAQVNFNAKVGSLTEASGVIKLSRVPQNTLQNLFLDYVGTVISLSNVPDSDKVYQYISNNIQSGHLAGVFSLKLKEVLNLDIESTGESYRDFTVTNNINQVTKNSIEMVLKALLDADYVTSNIYDKESIFASATKSVLGPDPYLEIELQVAKDNRAAGDLLQQAGRNLNNILNSVSGNASGKLGQYSDREGTVAAFTALIKSLKPLANMLLKRAKELQTIDSANEKIYLDIFSNAKNLDSLAGYLIDTKGSPSLKESLGQNIASLIKSGVTLKKIVTKVSKKDSSILKDPDINAINSILKKARSAVSGVKVKPNKFKVKSPSTLLVNLSNLTSIQTLINSQLQDVISANMGDGDARNVLNYRTGRLAASASVQRMSESRAGMITAFYTYMKNPYQTFESGFKQGSPKSRDPKLLIGKSIREIAAARVGNRLRAVSI